MLNKRLYFLIIFFIVVVVVLFRLVYPEAEVSRLMTVIPLTGILMGLGVNFVIQRIQNKKEAADANKKVS
jgi:hypothetical protein